MSNNSILKDSYETLIIGAGPAGLAAAMELSQEKKEFAVIEKQSRVGGLAKTYVVKEGDIEFRTDNGPHRFFSKNQYLYDFIEDILQEQWIQVRRQTRQYISGKFYDYPVNALQVVKNLGPITVMKAAWHYLIATIKYRWFRAPIRNFNDYALANFGKTLAELNIIGYTEKIWGVSATELHANWAKQRISGLNLVSVLTNSLKKAFSKGSSDSPKSLVDSFYYPEFGSGMIYEKICKKIIADGYHVELSAYPTAVHHTNQKITHVTLRTEHGETDVQLENLVESIHMDDFITLLQPAAPEEVLAACSKLRYRSQVYLFITLDKDRITDDQWLYYPDRSIPFARSSEMKNFSNKMAPAGKTSLFIEFFCNQDDPVYSMSAEELLNLALPYFEQFGFFSREEIRQVYRFEGGKDYPIYDIQYEENMKIVSEYLNQFTNLYYIGRPGRFKYTNQDHSLEMGILAAKSIIEGKKYDIGAVGTEDSYFEKGTIPAQ